MNPTADDFAAAMRLLAFAGSQVRKAVCPYCGRDWLVTPNGKPPICNVPGDSETVWDCVELKDGEDNDNV